MRVAFADCVLDTDVRHVVRDGVAVRLSPKAYDLLCALVEARPRVLSKDALYRRLWGDAFVVEANMANLVSEIRAALGDSARDARIIRTAHGFGYAFCAEARDVTEVSGAVSPTSPGATVATRRARHYLVWNQREFALPPGQHSVGRDPQASIRFDLPSVSRFHARLTITNAGATIEDLGSKNGTLVGGERLDGSAPLHDGDEIRVGSVVLVFREWAADRPTVTLADM